MWLESFSSSCLCPKAHSVNVLPLTEIQHVLDGLFHETSMIAKYNSGTVKGIH